MDVYVLYIHFYYLTIHSEEALDGAKIWRTRDYRVRRKETSGSQLNLKHFVEASLVDLFGFNGLTLQGSNTYPLQRWDISAFKQVTMLDV